MSNQVPGELESRGIPEQFLPFLAAAVAGTIDGSEVERKIEKMRARARRKSRMRNLLRAFSHYEVSGTFFEQPVMAVSGVVPVLIASKREGFNYSNPEDTITQNTIRTYRHESGLMGHMEKENGCIYKRVRIPLGLLQKVDTKPLSKAYPGIEESNVLGITKLENSSSAMLEGDLFCTERYEIGECPNQLLNAEVKKVKDMLTRYKESCKTLIRRKTRLKEYLQGKDIPKKLKNPNTPYMMIYAATAGHTQGRIFAVGAKAAGHLFSELLLPLEVAKQLRASNTSSGLGFVDEYLALERLPMSREFESRPTYTAGVFFEGDIVYSRRAAGMQDYKDLKSEIDTLGNRLLMRSP